MSGEMFDLSQDPMVKKTIKLKIGAGITSSLGSEHVLETAIADLIDNSIGNHASKINVRFQEYKGRITAIRISDDGSGMNLESLHEAMEISPSERKSKVHMFSMFGQGLKASSMSQARVLSIYTSPAAGEYYAARMVREDAGGRLEYAELFPNDAQSGFQGFDRDDSTGTVIEWSALEYVSKSGRQAERQQWLSETISKLSGHLGLIFHRFLQKNQVRISIDVLAEEAGRPGLPTIVEPIDPFGFETWGHEDFPLMIKKSLPKFGNVGIECFIIPAHSRSENARIMGQDRSEWQGLYVYWKDRLVHFADWAGLATAKKEYSLARVRIELNDRLREIVTMNPAKTGVVLKPVFANAVAAAVDSSETYTFDKYLALAREQLKGSNRRPPKVSPITRVGSGLPEEVLGRIETTLGWRDAQHKLSVEWGFVPQGQLFDVDFANRLIRLNSRYRVFLSATEANRHEDAPIVRTLLFLLLESYFKGGHLKQQTRDQVQGFQAILAAATEVQLREISEHEQVGLADEARKMSLEDFVESSKLEGQSAAANQDTDVGRTEVGPLEPEGPTQTDPSPPRPISAGRVVPHRVKKARALVPEVNYEAPPSIPAKTALAIATYYRKGKTITELAVENQISERDVVYSLTETVFGKEGLANDAASAFRHGESWDPDERQKLDSLYKKGIAISKIATQIGRTPFAVAWKLLDQPKGVEIPNSKLLALRKLWASGK